MSKYLLGCLIVVMGSSCFAAVGGVIGNETFEENGLPTSIAKKPCEKRYGWDRYWDYQINEKGNKELEKFFNFVKQVYPHLYRKIVASAKQTTICETNDVLRSKNDYLKAEDKKEQERIAQKRLALWDYEGEVNYDLLKIRSKKFYRHEMTDLYRAVTLFREFLQPAFFRNFSDAEQAEWAKHNLVNSFYYTYKGTAGYEVKDLLDMVLAFGLYPKGDYLNENYKILYKQFYDDCSNAQTCENIIYVMSRVDKTFESDRHRHMRNQADFIFAQNNFTENIDGCISGELIKVECIEKHARLNNVLLSFSFYYLDLAQESRNTRLAVLQRQAFELHQKQQMKELYQLIGLIHELYSWEVNEFILQWFCDDFVINVTSEKLCLNPLKDNVVEKIEFYHTYFKLDLMTVFDYSHSFLMVYNKSFYMSTVVPYDLWDLMLKSSLPQLVDDKRIHEEIFRLTPDKKKTVNADLDNYRPVILWLSYLVDKGAVTENRKKKRFDYIFLLERFPETAASANKLKQLSKSKP